MSPRVFLTGISGYIAGQFVTDLSRKYPDIQIVGLVRSDEQAAKIKAKLPSIITVHGDISSHDILFEEAKKADVVIQAADCDDSALVKTLIKGLAEGGKGGSFIQISGSASTVDISNGYGNLSTRIYDDIKDLEEITTFDSSHLHAEADQTVIQEGVQSGVRTALLSPTVVYGDGEGPVKTTSMTFVWLEEAIIKRGKGFTVGAGKNSWGGVHVKDVSSVIMMFLEDALRSEERKLTWGPDGVYYIVDKDYVFADVVPKMVELLKKKGLCQSDEIDQVSTEEATKIHPYGAFVWGTNSRCRASRLKSFGWKPTQPTYFDILSKRDKEV